MRIQQLRDLDKRLGELIDKKDWIDLQIKGWEARLGELEKAASNRFITQYECEVLYEEYINRLRELGARLRIIEHELQEVRAKAQEVMDSKK